MRPERVPQRVSRGRPGHGSRGKAGFRRRRRRGAWLLLTVARARKSEMNALPPGTVRTLAPPTPYLRYAALAFLCACSSGATPAGDSPVSDGGHAGSVDAGNLDARSSDTHDPVGAVADASAVDGPSGGDSGPSADAGATPPVDAGASRLAGGACPDLGWCELPNTKLEPVCPDPGTFNLSGSCGAVISAWNSGVADLPRNRLLFWGGGHRTTTATRSTRSTSTPDLDAADGSKSTEDCAGDAERRSAELASHLQRSQLSR